jgi:2-methylcitrate dehydratase PrpD
MITPLAAYGVWLADSPRRWDADVVRAAKQGLIDTLGVALRGSREPVVTRTLAAVTPWGRGPSRVIGHSATLPAPHAALVNGAAAHALDFDDNFDPAKAHASAVLIPAILAVLDEVGGSGADLIDAYAAGLQILGRIGDGVNPAHRRRGWHGTATIGTFGAAAAAARLLRLDAAQCTHALSLASSRAGGFISQFGTMAKPLHAGLAAQAGVMAATLARAGLEASDTILEGPTGLTGLMVSAEFDASRDGAKGFVVDDIASPPMLLSPGLRPKRFPNCGSAHRAMDALLILLARHPAGSFRHIRVHAPWTHLRNLMFTAPTTPDEAKFSLEHALSVLLADGAAGLDSFEAAAVARADIRALYPLIERIPFPDDDSRPTRVEISLADGGTDAEEVLFAVGSPQRPFSEAEIWAKFALCAGERPKLHAMLEGVDTLADARALTVLLSG